MDQRERPLRPAIVDDFAVVIAGVASFLADERIEVVETGGSLPVVSDVDIVLFDAFGQATGDGIDLEDYVRDSGAKVAIYRSGSGRRPPSPIFGIRERHLVTVLGPGGSWVSEGVDQEARA